MNRRQFLRAAAIGGTAVVATSVTGGWSLKRLRTWLARVFAPAATEVSARTVHTITTLSQAYRRSVTKLYGAYRRRLPEYCWVDAMPVFIPRGREMTIPLNVLEPA